MFAPVLDYRYRYPLPVEETRDSGTSPAPPLEEPDTGAQVQGKNVPAKYSPTFKMGLFFSVPCLSLVLLFNNLTRSRTYSRWPTFSIALLRGSRSSFASRRHRS
jgi:hypothetical protein